MKTKRKRHKTQKGITLIALVITIIVMLILVAVTITVAINGGLFEYAKNAKVETENAMKDEQKLADGRVKIDGILYDSIDEYLKGNPSKDQNIPMLSYDKTSKDTNGLLTANATYTSGEHTAIVPKGYKISEVEGENEIATGLVIKDINNNEFVWIPVESIDSNNYSYDAPTGENIVKYQNMAKSVTDNKGFWVGRYPTSVAEGKAESKPNATGTSSGTWQEMYDVQAAYAGANSAVVSEMIWGMQYSKIKDSNANLILNLVQQNQSDNWLLEWTQRSNGTSRYAEGHAGAGYGGEITNGTFENPTLSFSTGGMVGDFYGYSLGSRMALYIK